MDENDYLNEIRRYQHTLDEQLRAPDSWLALVGLHWLDEGENSVGSDPSSDIPLPESAAPAFVGTLVMENGQVTFTPAPEANPEIDGKPIRSEIELESDLNHNQSIIVVGEISFYLIVRGTRYGIRVKHENNPKRINFEGRIWWPINETQRVAASIEYYEPQKIVEVPDVLGNVNETAMDCALLFDIDGQACRLDAFGLPTGQFYILFDDLSCQNGSYPAGRFLVTETPKDNQVVIDFNKAHNPPCAFTSHATCPLPPKTNRLNVAIEAGERYQPMPGHK